MRGSTGTPMVIEYAPRKKGVHCKNCKFLTYGGVKSPYTCSLKNKPRHYTSVCICKDFKKKSKEETEIRTIPKELTEQEKALKAYNNKQKELARKRREELRAYKKRRKENKKKNEF